MNLSRQKSLLLQILQLSTLLDLLGEITSIIVCSLVRCFALVYAAPRLLMVPALFLVTSAVLAQTAPLAATPPMGWNSWYAFYTKVTDANVRAAADVLVSSGMRDLGYTYVNIDAGWEGGRDAQGNIQTNSKFSDMKALAD